LQKRSWRRRRRRIETLKIIFLHVSGFAFAVADSDEQGSHKGSEQVVERNELETHRCFLPSLHASPSLPSSLSPDYSSSSLLVLIFSPKSIFGIQQESNHNNNNNPETEN
jgi:hypothetical protein